VTDTRARRKAADPPREDAQRAGDYVLEDQVGFLLRCAHQRATETFNAVMAEFSITPTQFAALAKLDDLQAVSQNQLGRLTAMDPATISGVIGRLTTRGYVQASPDPKDARVAMLGLTPAGKSAVTAMKAVAADVSGKTLEPLTEAEAAALVSALGKIG
jgi:DNA-binding MarR family transcriptional regulator